MRKRSLKEVFEVSPEGEAIPKHSPAGIPMRGLEDAEYLLTYSVNSIRDKARRIVRGDLSAKTVRDLEQAINALEERVTKIVDLIKKQGVGSKDYQGYPLEEPGMQATRREVEQNLPHHLTR